MPSKVPTISPKQYKKTVQKVSADLLTRMRKVLPQHLSQKACINTVAVINDVNSTYSDVEGRSGKERFQQHLQE
jgi:hypothetical protein